ncbi:hypothetical protein BGX34_001813 [Mortierella sp. NVP85]|nr:hypothetical protein BGX34_001813 [Mortierella sp. NVP85]
MEVTQSFRLTGGTDIIEILCDNVDSQNIVHWAAIEEIFPGVKYIKRGCIAVNSMMGPNQTRSIKRYPGVVLDVVLSTSGGNEPTTVGRISNPSMATFQHNPPFNDQDSAKSALADSQVVGYVQKNDIESDVEQPLVASPSSDLQSKTLTSSTPDALVQAIKAGDLGRLGEQLIGCLQDLKNEVAKNNELVLEINQVVCENKELLIRLNDLQQALDSKQDEMKELQIQALDRLALIQNNVKALLMQTYELHEYPIPRLFIVLPDEKSSWNPMDFFSNKFRLYFLCECGEHTKATNSKIPHHIHLAKHEGYDIDRPNEFFQQYGSYVLTILRMLKFGISVAGVAIPALSQLIRVDGHGQATASLKLLEKTIEPGMDKVIKHIDKANAGKGEVLIGLSEQMENNEALEGADLRQLESFLKNKDSNRVLGNLYRTVTGEGHVKWVCLDHFRENYHAIAAQAFRETVNTLRGTFDENIGRAEVTLPSKLQAGQFYRVLESAKSVYELKVVLDWDTTQSDFKMLRNILPKTNVGVLELYLTQHDVPTRDLLNRNQRFDPVLDIVQHCSIQSFTIRGTCDFTKRSSLLSRDYDFSNLRHLNISLDQLKDDTLGIKLLISKSSNLSSLTLGSSAGFARVPRGETVGSLDLPSTLRHLDIPLYQLKDDIPGVTRLLSNASNLLRLTIRTGTHVYNHDYVLQTYNAIAEHRTYPINFKEWDLCLPPPPTRESDQSMAARQSMEHLLNFYCGGAPNLNKNGQRLIWSTVESLKVSSDEDIGRVEVTLRSRAQAEYFYSALTNARLAHELKIELDWELTQGDFDKLRDALVTTNIGVLELYLMNQGGSTGNLLDRNQLHNSTLDLMDLIRHGYIQSFTIKRSHDSSELSQPTSHYDISNLLHLDISLQEMKSDIPGFTSLITKASNLSSLAIGTGPLEMYKDNGYILEAYNSIEKYRTYPINFKDLYLVIPPPMRESDQSAATRQYMESLLEYYCKHGGTLWVTISEEQLSKDAMAKVTTHGSAFKALKMEMYCQVGGSYIDSICGIVGQSELYSIEIYMYPEEGERLSILKSIQWEHLHHLVIKLEPGTSETDVMQALVDGVTKMSNKVVLDLFEFRTEAIIPLIPPEGDLLRVFLSSMALISLELEID